jgi:hypothetical protein
VTELRAWHGVPLAEEERLVELGNPKNGCGIGNLPTGAAADRSPTGSRGIERARRRSPRTALARGAAVAGATTPQGAGSGPLRTSPLVKDLGTFNTSVSAQLEHAGVGGA